MDFIISDEKANLLLTSIGLELIELSEINNTEVTLKTNKQV